MTTPNRWAIRDCGQAHFFNLETLKAIVSLRTLKTTGVETTGETSYARGGPGNAKIVGFSSNREAKLTLEDAIFDNKAIGMLMGNMPEVGAKKIDKNEIITIGATSAASVTKTPVGNLISVFAVNADGTNGQEYTLGTPGVGKPLEYSVNAKELTFYQLTQGTKIRVYYYVNTDVTATTLKVTTDAFGGSFRVVVDVLVRDEYTKVDYQGQIRIPVAKFEDTFTLNLSADGDPAQLSLPLEIMKDPTNEDMWELVIYDADLIV